MQSELIQIRYNDTKTRVIKFNYIINTIKYNFSILLLQEYVIFIFYNENRNKEDFIANDHLQWMNFYLLIFSYEMKLFPYDMV